MKKRVLIIGGTNQVIRKAKELGLGVLYIQKPGEFQNDCFKFADQVVLMDYSNIDELIPVAKGLHEAFHYECAMSMNEYGLIPAASVNEALNLCGTKLDIVQLLKDKWAMRKKLKSENFSVVNSQVGKSRTDILMFCQENGFPVIVKPSDGEGSRNIYLIDKPSTVEEAWMEIKGSDIECFLMEEYLDGIEVSVEAFSFNGNHVVIAITDKRTLPNFVEMGHSVPSNINGTKKMEIIHTVTSFLNIVGLKDGPSHTELKLTSKGVKIIESHNRRGGDRINELVQIAYGIDMESMAFGWQFGMVDKLENSPSVRAGAAIGFFVPKPGIVTEILGYEEARNKQGVKSLMLKVKVGDLVPTIRSSHDRVGYVITEGRDASEAIEICENTLKSINIVTQSTKGEL